MPPSTPSLTHRWTPRLVLALLLLVAWLAALRSPLAQANDITVTSAADTTGGPDCTLRDAITAANTDTATGGCAAGGGADTITFAGNYTITLASALPALSGPLTLDGAGQSVAVSGNDTVRVFDIQAGAVVTISQLSIISGTVSDAGGGIRTNGTLTLLNSTLSGNRAIGTDAVGGGIANGDGSTVTVTNSTLSDNSASSNGGGIFNASGPLHLRNSLIADSPAGGDCLNNATILTNINNLIEDGSCNTGATDFVSGDPNLGPLQDNGGPTFTRALLPDSPAIDAAGDCTVFLDPDEDQRGVARPLDGDDDGSPACDIGAFEVGSSQTFIYLPLILTSEVSN
jgi:CSLREA domain-containing protein